MSNNVQQNGDEHISNESLGVWYQAILAKYSSFDMANSSLESKTGIIFAAAVALLIFSASKLTTDRQIDVLQLIGITAMVIVVVLCLVALRVRTGATPTHTTREMPSYYRQTDDKFIWQQIADLEDAVTRETKVNVKKARLYSWALYLFGAAGVLLALSQVLGISATIWIK